VEFFDVGRTRDPVPGDTLRALAWEARQIERRHRDFLAALPPACRLEVESLGPVLFCHGSPRSDEEIITAITPDA
jgi:diadenosine tetraphosphatase ApaH/serine/threonine PP2A family protein phosphatase